MTTPTTDRTYTYDNGSNKPSAKIFTPHFYSDGKYAFINLDDEIVIKLRVTDKEKFMQEITDDGNILLKKISQHDYDK